MFGEIWFLGISFFLVATAIRYWWLRLYFQRRFPLWRLFSVNSLVSGGEAIMLICQLIGLSWIVLGLIFTKVITESSNILGEILDEIIWSGPILLFSWLFASKIKK